MYEPIHEPMVESERMNLWADGREWMYEPMSRW
jgi:hypothetical protein